MSYIRYLMVLFGFMSSTLSFNVQATDYSDYCPSLEAHMAAVIANCKGDGIGAYVNKGYSHSYSYLDKSRTPQCFTQPPQTTSYFSYA